MDSAETPLKQSSIKIGKERPAQTRYRASTACAACRDRRIRCVVPAGDRICTQCRRAKTECIIKNDDERRRPISKAYVNTLTERVAYLEGMLLEMGKPLPGVAYPPKTRTEAPLPTAHLDVFQFNSDQRYGSPRTSPPSILEDSAEGGNLYQNDQISRSHPAPRIVNQNEGVLSRILSARGHLAVDESSGRLEFSGPSSNCHIYAESRTSMSQETTEQARRAEQLIHSLPLETHDYLLDLFWDHYNSVINVVRKEAFLDNMHSSRNQYYSGFLHVVILAMGYRLADKERDDIKMVQIGNGESTFHREARYMIDMEMRTPGGIPTVQGFLMLGDLEFGIGKDRAGWLYTGVANRLCFDLGLHLDCSTDGLSETETRVSHSTLSACTIYDKVWALYVGRPTCIKSSDIEMYLFNSRTTALSTAGSGEQQSPEAQINEQFLSLMDIVGKIADIKDINTASDQPNNAYLYTMNLDRQMQGWYGRLPESLVWKPSNISSALPSFFLLHQQYFCSLALLHRPWAKFNDMSFPVDSLQVDDRGNSSSANSQANASRMVCVRQAILLARSFWHYRQVYSTRRMSIMGLQHAGTAATVLLAAISSDTGDRNFNKQHLELLMMILHDMSFTYQPATRMFQVLQNASLELNSQTSAASPIRLTFPDNAWNFQSSMVLPLSRDASPDINGGLHEPRSVTPARRPSPFSELHYPTSENNSALGSLDLEEQQQQHHHHHHHHHQQLQLQQQPPTTKKLMVGGPLRSNTAPSAVGIAPSHPAVSAEFMESPMSMQGMSLANGSYHHLRHEHGQQGMLRGDGYEIVSDAPTGNHNHNNQKPTTTWHTLNDIDYPIATYAVPANDWSMPNDQYNGFQTAVMPVTSEAEMLNDLCFSY